MSRYAFVSAGVVLLFLTGLAWPCLHPPADYKGSLVETSQQAIIFWRAGREELILKVDYKMEPTADLPKHIAWVVPVPNKPDSYAVVKSQQIFEEAFQLADMIRGRALVRNTLGALGGAIRNLVVGKVTVGEYDITELKATGPNAAKELNAWLNEGGYGEVPEENMAYYVKHEWTFLAIKINKDATAKELAKVGGFRPLRISFQADRIYYPLKFSSHQGEFDVTLYVFAEQPIALPKWLRERGFTDHGFPSLPADSKIDDKNLRWNEGYWREVAGFSAKFKDKKKKAEVDKRLQWIKDQDPKAETEIYRLVREMEKGKLGKFKELYLTQISGHIKIKGKGPSNVLEDWQEDFQLKVAKEDEVHERPIPNPKNPIDFPFSARSLEPKLTLRQDGDDLIVSTTVTVNNSAHVLWTYAIVAQKEVYLYYFVFQNRDFFVRSIRDIEVKWRLVGHKKGEARYHVHNSFLPNSAELQALLPQLQKLAAEGAKREHKSAPTTTWRGRIYGDQLKEVPPAGYIADDKALAKLWKAWKIKDEMPTVDFDKDLVLVVTSESDIGKIHAGVDKNGDVTALRSGPDNIVPEGRGYGITIFPRAGVKTINGKPIDKDKLHLSLTTAFLDKAVKVSATSFPAHWISLRATLDAVGNGKGTLILDPNRGRYNAFGDHSPPITEIATRSVEITLKKVNIADPAMKGRKLYEIWKTEEGHLFLVVSPQAAGPHRLIVKDKDGNIERVLALEPVPVPLPPCHPGCFPAGTLVLTPAGSAPIETLQAGDMILGIDAKGKPCPTKVRSVFVSQAVLVEVETENGSLRTTTKQPLSLNGGGIKTGEELAPGDELLRWQDGQRKPTKIRALRPTKKLQRVFNLVLADQEFFVAGGFLVRSKPPAIAEAIFPAGSRKDPE